MIFVYLFFTGSNSNPDDDRLLERLFDRAYQRHNLLTTPNANKYETINVTVGIEILKFVALVSFNILHTLRFSYVCCRRLFARISEFKIFLRILKPKVTTFQYVAIFSPVSQLIDR